MFWLWNPSYGLSFVQLSSHAFSTEATWLAVVIMNSHEAYLHLFMRWGEPASPHNVSLTFSKRNLTIWLSWCLNCKEIKTMQMCLISFCTVVQSFIILSSKPRQRLLDFILYLTLNADKLKLCKCACIAVMNERWTMKKTEEQRDFLIFGIIINSIEETANGLVAESSTKKSIL